jgi:hypothetical protein
MKHVYDLLGRKFVVLALKMEAVGFSTFLVRDYQVMRRHIAGYHAIGASIATAPYAEMKRSLNFHFIWFQVIIIWKRSTWRSFQLCFRVFSVHWLHETCIKV